MSKVNKTVRAYSIKLTDEQFEAFDKLFNEYAKVENEMLKRFCGIQYMSDICKWSIIRDKIRAEQNKIKENRKKDDNNNNESKDSKKSKNSKDNKNNKVHDKINKVNSNKYTRKFKIIHILIAIVVLCCSYLFYKKISRK